jgi:hypothetical protein
MRFVEPGKRARGMALLDTGTVEDTGEMAKVLETVGKQPGGGFERLLLENDMFGCGDGEADEFYSIGHGVLLVVPGATLRTPGPDDLFGFGGFTKPLWRK